MITIDDNEIKRALRLLFEPGDVFEVRALGAKTCMRNGMESSWERVMSGYFDYDHIDAVPDQLAKISSAKGIYVVLNPVKHDYIYRTNNNSIEAVGNGMTTTDSGITRRRWFFMDFDAVREVSNISSNNEEHHLTQVKADIITSYLKGIGWPDPIIIDSGNGTHVLYKTDLPADDGGVIRAALNEIKGASDRAVEIDATVFNPSRLIRLPGTRNCKGVDSLERPHRLAHIIDEPKEIMQVTEEMIKAISRNEKCEPVLPSESYNDSEWDDGFDIDEWVSRYCPDAHEAPVNGSSAFVKKWIFDVCPFNPDHNNKSAVIMKLANGRWCFKCHHNGCSGNHWPELRALREPDYRDRISSLCENKYPDVDLSDLLKEVKATVEPVGIAASQYITEAEQIISDMENDREDHPWRHVTDDDVAAAVEGTFIGDLCDIYGNVTMPRLPIAVSLLKSIITAGCAISGEAPDAMLNERVGGNLGTMTLSGVCRSNVIIKTGGGDFCNFYGILVGNSGTGKDIGHLIDDFANFQNPSAKCEEGKSTGDYMIGNRGSAEGIADALMKKPNGLLVISEFQNWLDENHWQHSAMDFLTEAWDKGYFSYAMSKRGGNSTRSVLYCSPSAIANVQPEIFEKLATKDLIYSGAFGRWLFARMPDKERFYGRPNSFDKIEMLKRMERIVTVFQKKIGYVEVPSGYNDDLFSMFANKVDNRLESTWCRLSNQYFTRLATILSVTHDQRTQCCDIRLTDMDFERAKTLVMWFFNNAEKTLLSIGRNDEIVAKREESIKAVCMAVCKLYAKYKRPVCKQFLSLEGIVVDGNKLMRSERNLALDELCERMILKRSGSGFVPDHIPQNWK